MILTKFIFLLCVASSIAAPQSQAAMNLALLKAPPGYQIEIFSDQVPGARSLTVSPAGTVFVGTRESKVYAIKDGKTYVIAEHLDMPNGVAFKDRDLYIAEISKISKLTDIESHLTSPPKPVVLYSKLPTETHHGWKFIAFGPDGALYVPQGMPCNVCKKEDPRFGTILRFKAFDGSEPEIYAKGIRNTVGFTWNRTGNELWFTDNGRDMMGDDVPPDELNVASGKGMNFGFPFCHGGTIQDPEFGAQHPCNEFVKPVWNFQAHSATLGLRFLDANTLLVAEHGSWNRSKKVGYQVVQVNLKNGKPDSVKPFLTGFLQADEKVVGRPVDIQVLADHSVLVSDDENGIIYRLSKRLSKR